MPRYADSQLSGNPFHMGTSPQGVKRILLKHGRCIDAMKIRFKNDAWGVWHGGPGGDFTIFDVRDGDHITKVDMWYDWNINPSGDEYKYVLTGLQFTTESGEVSEAFGRGHGEQHVCNWHDGQILIGFKGKKGSFIDEIKPIFGPKPVREIQKVICKLVPIYEIEQGADFERTVTTKYRVGTKSTNFSRQEVTDFASQASAKVSAKASWSIEGAKGSAKYSSNYSSKAKSAYESALSSTETEHEFEQKDHINARRGGIYLYQGFVELHFTDGNIVTMRGSSLVGSSTQLVGYDEVTF